MLSMSAHRSVVLPHRSRRDKIAALQELVGNRPDVHILQGDCNVLLLNDVLPKVAYRDFRRALCLLDPYGLHLNWQVLQRAGSMQSVEMFLNFPVADMNRNVLWRRDLTRLTRPTLTA